MLATIAERSAISDERFAAPNLGRLPIGANLLDVSGLAVRKVHSGIHTFTGTMMGF